jgi:hypothetical protein
VNYPNQENIDRWLFDWTEGNLSSDQVFMLEEFLLVHPEHQIDADLWQQANLSFPEFTEQVEIKIPEEKSKKRRAVLWMLPMLLLPLLFLIPYFTTNPAQQKTASTPKSMQRIANTSSSRIVLNKPNRNLSHSKAYANVTQPKPMISRAYANTVNKIQNNFNNSQTNAALAIDKNSTIEANIQNQPSILEAPRQMEKITLSAPNKIKELHSDIADQGIASESTSTGEDIAIEKSKNQFNLPTLKISKNSRVAKYLMKDVVASSQKDRIYLVPEKSHLDLNMGLAGDMSQNRFQSTSIVRWFNQTPNQKLTQQLSFDTYLRNVKSGLGVTANYSHFGTGAIQDWNVNVLYSPKIAIGQYVSLSPSIGYQLGRKSVNINKINNLQNFAFNSNQVQQFNYNMSLPVGQKLWYRDLSAGMLVNAGPIYVGGQVTNVLRHQDNINTNDFDTVNRANRTYGILCGTDFKAKKGLIVFSPTVYHERNASYAITQYSATLQLNHLVIGGNYGSNKNISCMVGFTSERFALLMQSTKMRNVLSQPNSYTHQLTLRINSNISRKTRRYLYL